MNKINIIISVVAFVVITVFLYLSNLRKISKKKKNKKKNNEIVEVRYLTITYNLQKEKLLQPKILFIISILDAFIICVVFLLVVLLPWKIYWQLLLGFVIMIGLIYSLYGILGKILEKRGYKK